MPIHNAGYRSWDGRRVPEATRWTVIASTGIRRTWKSKWLRRLLFFSVLPTMFLAIPLFLFEQAARDPRMWRDLMGFMRVLPPNEAMAPILNTDVLAATPEQLDDARHHIWAYLLLTLFRYPQAVLMVLVIGIAAPPLISNDVRTRAFLIYFSRPITRTEYILGKLGTMVFYLAMITTLPALMLYAVGVLLSPSSEVIALTWDLPLRILLASAMLILPTTSTALMFSSMTSESRYAAFVWFAMWILGYVMFTMVMVFTFARRLEPVTPGLQVLLSPYHILGVVQAWVFGMNTDFTVLAPAAAILTVTTIVSLAILYHRVSAPMRV